MRDTYEQFTERVMTTRTGKIKDIDAVARGRIFMAKQAGTWAWSTKSAACRTRWLMPPAK